jgi:hypothetical protein
MGWTIQFIKDYKDFKKGDILELDESGLCIHYCNTLKVAKRIA